MVILITGITSGFGKAMAARLSADGHKVYGTHRKATDFLPGVTYIRADAQKAEECEAAVKQVVDAEGYGCWCCPDRSSHTPLLSCQE